MGRHEFTPDFTIRSLFPVTADQFFGHYHVAGGYHTVSSLGDRRTTFFPVWIEPDGDVHFAKVEYFVPGNQRPGAIRVPEIVTTNRDVPLQERERHVREENALETR